jgi:hypothetical protein
MLSNNERTPQVIRNAMLKLGLEGNPDSYTLAQVLPDKGKRGETTLLTCEHKFLILITHDLHLNKTLLYLTVDY